MTIPEVRVHLTSSALDAAVAVLVVRGINTKLIHQLEQAADEIRAQEETVSTPARALTVQNNNNSQEA